MDVPPAYPLDGESDPNNIAIKEMEERNNHQAFINNPHRIGGSRRKKKHTGGSNVPGEVEVKVPVGGRDTWGNDARETIKGGIGNLLTAQSNRREDHVDQECGPATGGGLKRKKKSKKNKRKSKRKGKTKRKTKRKTKSKRKSKRKIKRK